MLTLKIINTLGVTGDVMFCCVIQNTKLCSRWNNHMFQRQMVWPIVYDVLQIFCQGVADRMATVVDVVTTVLCLEGVMPRHSRCCRHLN